MTEHGFIYFHGTEDGLLVKIGYTKDLAMRRRQNEQRFVDDKKLVLLAAVIGTRTHEAAVLRFFETDCVDGQREWFNASQSLVEYILWLRQQWWVTLDEADTIGEPVEYTHWQPQESRRVPLPKADPRYLIQLDRVFHGDLAGTAWDRLGTPEPIGEDYYSPAELVSAAKQAMGGIDLDPASHWRANRVFRIPLYYNLHRSAFDNPWFGRVWLNPPYGDNAPWFERIVQFWDRGEINQLCMISPVWSFTTQIAIPLLDRAAAMLLLIPAPKFWGNPDGRQGTNHPHAILYMGSRVDEFYGAFIPFGTPFQLVRPSQEMAPP